jgi:hypothetical protein
LRVMQSREGTQFFNTKMNRNIEAARKNNCEHDARMLDHRAAVLIAGHAGMANINTVWVDCNPHRGWLDKNDEKKLMNMAYENMTKDGEWLDRFQSTTSHSGNMPFATKNTYMAQHFVDTMKQFHAKFIQEQVVCLSPAAEAAMEEITMNTIENEPSFANFAAKYQENGRDFYKELSILLRRMVCSHGHFCKVVGRVLAFRNSLQQGTAITAVRLCQLEKEMLRAIMAWEGWLQQNTPRILNEVENKMGSWIKHDDADENIPESYYNQIPNKFNYDWVSGALDALYAKQQEIDEPDVDRQNQPPPDQEEGGGAFENMAAKRPRTAGSGSIYELVGGEKL